MPITKCFELRDAGTFIPVIATQMLPSGVNPHEWDRERYLLRRSGYGPNEPLIVLCRMFASGCDRNASYDPYAWCQNRTMLEAHLYIQDHWDKLRSGDVIDIEYIKGETKTPKKSEETEEQI